jgi:DNA-binding NarL/FixJ family response regulator
VKILVADDHALFRDGLRYLLGQLGEPVEILDAKDGAGALELAEAHPDLELVLLDLGMPGIDGLAGLRLLRARCPAVPVVILSGSEEPADVSALRLVLSGGMYLPPSYAERSQGMRVPLAASSVDSLGLTPRQLDVLRLLGQGHSNKEIARVLKLAEGTVKLHISAILRALGVDNRTRAVVAAARLLGVAQSEKPAVKPGDS